MWPVEWILLEYQERYRFVRTNLYSGEFAKSQHAQSHRPYSPSLRSNWTIPMPAQMNFGWYPTYIDIVNNKGVLLKRGMK